MPDDNIDRDMDQMGDPRGTTPKVHKPINRNSSADAPASPAPTHLHKGHVPTADPGRGSVDATDAVTLTTAQHSPDDGGTPTARDPDYRKGGASGALGPEDLQPGDDGRALSGGVDPTGPDATSGPPGFDPHRDVRRGDTGLGQAQPTPGDPGSTNLPGPADEARGRANDLRQKSD